VIEMVIICVGTFSFSILVPEHTTHRSLVFFFICLLKGKSKWIYEVLLEISVTVTVKNAWVNDEGGGQGHTSAGLLLQSAK
jgi:hypothetical protein